MLDDNVKGGTQGWSRLKVPTRLLPVRPPSPVRPPTPTPGRRGMDPRVVHALFNLVGLLVGIAGGIWAWMVERSIALSIFVFYMVLNLVGRGLGDVVTDRSKIRRFLYFSLLPVFGTAILLGTYRQWGMWWLSAILGIFGGVLAWGIVGAWWFPDIDREEDADTEVRFREARRGR